MRIEQVAAQLYTLRDHLKTPSDIASTLRKVKAVGYQAVQLSGLGPVPEDDLARMLDGEGLTVCATHEPGPLILSDPARVAERLHNLRCRYTAYPYPHGVRLETLDDVRAFAGCLNASGRALREAGCVLAYHNHHIEFRRFGGRLMLDVLYEETDPGNLLGELDTYWVQYGGGDPVAWCRRLKGRLPLLHMKDYAVAPDNTISFAEIGCGNLDWDEIVKAAERSGCEWFIVEQDICRGDPFESLRISLDYIKDKLL